MDRRTLLKGGLILAGAAGFVGYPFLLEFIEENKKEVLRKHIRGVLENIVTLVTVTKFKTYDEQENPSKNRQSGQGIIIGDYVLTVDHIVSYNRIIDRTPFGYVMTPINKLEETTTIGKTELEQIAGSEERDIAILKLPKDYKKPKYKVRLGDDDELKLLDDLYFVSDAFDWAHIVRLGHLGKEGVAESSGKDFRMHNGKAFAGNIVVPGDSGSPLLNKDGELVGIMASLTANGVYGIFNPINWYKGEIAKYEAKQKALKDELPPADTFVE